MPRDFDESSFGFGRILSLGLLAVVGLIGLFSIFGSFYTIGETERGVLLRNGAFQSIVTPGFNWKVPFIDGVVTFPLTQQAYTNDPAVPLESYSQDLQVAKIEINVIWQIDPGHVEDVYRKFRTIETAQATAIVPRVQQALKEVLGQYNAASSVTQRVKLGVDVRNNLTSLLADEPFDIIGLQIKDVDYGEEYNHRIQERASAEVAVLQQKQVLEKEKIDAEIQVVQAEGQAKSVTARATADANAIKLRGDAEAYAIQRRADAIAKNPSIVALTQAERWDGKLPVTMLPNTTIPFMSMNQFTTQPDTAKQ